MAFANSIISKLNSLWEEVSENCLVGKEFLSLKLQFPVPLHWPVSQTSLRMTESKRAAGLFLRPLSHHLAAWGIGLERTILSHQALSFPAEADLQKVGVQEIFAEQLLYLPSKIMSHYPPPHISGLEWEVKTKPHSNSSQGKTAGEMGCLLCLGFS